MAEGLIRRIDKYDGQLIYKDGSVIYDLGNYLGGGAAGSVYQGIGYPNEKQVAVKVLRPVGFKLVPSGQLRSSTVIHKGKLLNQDQISGKSTMNVDNLWWLIHASTKQLIAAYEDPVRSQLRELPLPKCIEIWGWTPFCDESISVESEEKRNIGAVNVQFGGTSYNIPHIAPKYLKWLRSRHKMCREMATMVRVGEHPNVVDLYEVLELIQDDKATLFLVMELVNGGELFDKIRSFKTGCPEDFARKYITQLLSGIDYCHQRGVCHRDLKPENLLLSDLTDSAVLKIADFGLSELIYHVEDGQHCSQDVRPSTPSKNCVSTGYQTPLPKLALKRFRSVVGSPHYLAPEITTQDPMGYDGRSVDMWSAGVILYSLLTGSLPFEEDMLRCPRFKRFQRWVDTEYTSSSECVFPSWFFPSHLSHAANALIVALLHHDPALRLTAASALQHPWCLATSRASNADSTIVKAMQHSSNSSPRSQLSVDSMHGPKHSNWSSASDEAIAAAVNQVTAHMSNSLSLNPPPLLPANNVLLNKSLTQEYLQQLPTPYRRCAGPSRKLIDHDVIRVLQQHRDKEAAERVKSMKSSPCLLERFS